MKKFKLYELMALVEVHNRAVEEFDQGYPFYAVIEYDGIRVGRFLDRSYRHYTYEEMEKNIKDEFKEDIAKYICLYMEFKKYDEGSYEGFCKDGTRVSIWVTEQ